jgi:urease accessory protein
VTRPAPSVASIRFRAGIGGEPVLEDVSPSAAHTFKPARFGATVVGSAAHPVSGDRAALKVSVGVGCCAEIRSENPTFARRSALTPHRPEPAHSVSQVGLTVASDGMLTWRPEPGVAGDGSDHRCDAHVELASSARLLWRDEFLVDRRGDGPPGTWTSRLRVVRDGWPVVCTELAIGPGSPFWESPAVMEGARAISVMVVVDPGLDPDGWSSTRAGERSATAAALPLAGPGIQIVAWGDDLVDCRAAIQQVVPQCGVPEWAAERWRRGRALDVVG